MSLLNQTYLFTNCCCLIQYASPILTDNGSEFTNSPPINPKPTANPPHTPTTFPIIHSTANPNEIHRSNPTHTKKTKPHDPLVINDRLGHRPHRIPRGSGQDPSFLTRQPSLPRACKRARNCPPRPRLLLLSLSLPRAKQDTHCIHSPRSSAQASHRVIRRQKIHTRARSAWVISQRHRKLTGDRFKFARAPETAILRADQYMEMDLERGPRDYSEGCSLLFFPPRRGPIISPLGVCMYIHSCAGRAINCGTREREGERRRERAY